MPPRCAHDREQLVDFVDGELPPAESEQVRRHIAGCPDCRATVERLQASLAIAQELWHSTTTVTASRPRRIRPRLLSLRAAAAVAAALALAVATWTLTARRAAAPAPTATSPVLPVAVVQADAQRVIASEGAAARLLAAAELLSSAPAGEQYACARFESIAKLYPESAAAETARARLREHCHERNVQ